jgi:hypothetical protein
MPYSAPNNSGVPRRQALTQENIGFAEVSGQGDDAYQPTITVSTGGIHHEYGSWVQLTPATSQAVYGIIILAKMTGGSTRKICFDLGVGAASAEVPIVQKLPLYLSATSTDVIFSFFVPVSIPAGSRIAARIVDNNGIAITVCFGVSLLE